MKYPFVRQKDLKDCGCCCLLMITRYFGGSVSLEYLREITNTTKSGVSAYDLIEGSKKIGFNSYGVKGNISDINSYDTPIIAHIVYKKSYEHFVVIYKIDHKKKILLVADPDKGIKKMTFVEFNKISSGVFIIIKPVKKIMYVEENKHLKEIIMSFIYHNKIILSEILGCSVLISISQILISFQFKFLIEYVINYFTTYNLLFLAILYLMIILLKEYSNYKRNNSINYINHLLDKSLFTDVYNHILSLPYLYYKNRTTGEIVARMNDLTEIRNVISKSLISIFFDLLLLLVAFITLFFISLKLTFIIIATIILLLIIIYSFNNILDKRIIESKIKASNVNSYLVETISGIETIKNQNIVSYIKNKFLYKYMDFNNSSYKYNKTFIKEDFLKNLIIGISNLILLIYGSYLCVKGSISLPVLITYTTLANYVFDPIFGITNLLLSIKEAKISFKRIKELYEVREEKNNSNSNYLKSLNGNIVANNLSYSYDNNTDLLKNINIDIKKNSKVLIYGNSGSGKSTLAKIICGNLKVKNNSLFINNKDINHYNNNLLRSKICYIGNNETLFTESIFDNIVLDKEKNENIDKVIDLCLLPEFVERLPLTYDTLIEENGFNLSGGQKQRIILARSLLKDSDIYILDEALNQVDIIKEREILKKLFKEYKDKTFIYISHRFNNEDLFDKKYKIEDGVII